MSTIGPGTMLVCVTDAMSPYGVHRGRIYECDHLEGGYNSCGRCGYDGDGIILVGIPKPIQNGDYLLWCPCGFVPAGRRGDFAHLLVSEPVKEDA